MNVALMTAELTLDEGRRLLVYDDATGQPIKPGSIVKGHPTIGVGRALDERGLSSEESEFLLANDIKAFTLGLQQAYPWFSGITDVRQRVLVNMAFNIGLGGIAGFQGMLKAIASGDFDMAAAEMRDSEWFRQVGARAARLADAMSSGVAQ